MKIISLFRQQRPVFSFEVFPPKRDGDVASLYRCFEELEVLKPDFISVTYGAGGSNKGMHFEVNTQLLKMGITPLAHFTCVGHDRASIAEQLRRLEDAGVENILALRGDPPKGADRFERPVDGFGHADELIAFIKSKFKFCVGAACYPEVHPEASGLGADLANLKRKADAGADFLMTQMFFDNAAYARFVADCRSVGIAQPIMPGVMPVLTPKFFSRDWGVRIPAELKQAIQGAPDAQEAERRGIEFAVRQCRALLAMRAPGLHLYAMNKAAASLKIHEALKAPQP
jgi:methylenetetrahydrofolate reductase (NADPH)